MAKSKSKPSNYINNNPELKNYIDNFAMDMSKTLVGQIDKLKDQNTYELDSETKRIMEEKGKEFGVVIKNILNKNNKSLGNVIKR